MMNRYIPLFLVCLFLAAGCVKKQAEEQQDAPNSSLLQSGPMVGYSAFKEVMLWVQTNEPAQVHFNYWIKDSIESELQTDQVTGSKQFAYVTKLVADRLIPGRTYEYALFINDERIEFDYPTEFQSQELWQYRHDPPTIRFALGSCSYVGEPEYDRPGDPYGGDYDIFEAIHKKKPDFMLWLGDNTYLREVDWDSRSGILHRHTHTRSLAEMQPLLASTHHYAIWDDHDFGPNDSDGSYALKRTAEEAFNLFWANPTTDVTGEGGITGTFEWADVQFFLLDNRFHRRSHKLRGGGEQVFGDAQIQWLTDALKFSRARFKFIVMGGQFISDAKVHENVANFEAEKERILKMLEQENVWGVFFLDGDRHHSALSKLERPGNYPLHDLTVSPLTSSARAPEDEPNNYLVDSTMVGERNFAMMTISGERTDRLLTIELFDKDGQELWKKEIKANDLRPPRRDDWKRKK